MKFLETELSEKKKEAEIKKETFRQIMEKEI